MKTDELLKIVIDALEEIKAIDIKTLDVRDRSSITDIMVIASGATARQVKALSNSVAVKCKEVGIPPISVEGEQEGEWALVDVGDVVVHIMQPAIRDYYNIEKLWGDDNPQDDNPGMTPDEQA